MVHGKYGLDPGYTHKYRTGMNWEVIKMSLIEMGRSDLVDSAYEIYQRIKPVNARLPATLGWGVIPS